MMMMKRVLLGAMLLVGSYASASQLGRSFLWDDIDETKSVKAKRTKSGPDSWDGTNKRSANTGRDTSYPSYGTSAVWDPETSKSKKKSSQRSADSWDSTNRRGIDAVCGGNPLSNNVGIKPKFKKGQKVYLSDVDLKPSHLETYMKKFGLSNDKDFYKMARFKDAEVIVVVGDGAEAKYSIKINDEDAAKLDGAMLHGLSEGHLRELTDYGDSSENEGEAPLRQPLLSFGSNKRRQENMQLINILKKTEAVNRPHLKSFLDRNGWDPKDRTKRIGLLSRYNATYPDYSLTDAQLQNACCSLGDKYAW